MLQVEEKQNGAVKRERKYQKNGEEGACRHKIRGTGPVFSKERRE